jgi:hypothetical protein
VGSIGVIDTLAEQTAQDAMMGVRYAIVTSGARKADGNAHVAISEEALAATQTIVDDVAQAFFEHVAAARGLGVAAVAALSAGQYTGGTAAGLKLVDRVATLEQTLAAIAAGETPATGSSIQGSHDMKYSEAVAALVEAAKSDDDEGKQAKKMLAVLGADDSEEKPEEKEEPAAKSEGDEEKPEEKPAPSAAATASLAALAASVQTLTAKIAGYEAREAASTFAALKASRPDIAESVWTAIAPLPLKQATAIVAATPRAGVANPSLERAPIAGASVAQLGNFDASSALAQSSNPDLDAAFGLAPKTSGVVLQGAVLQLGAPVPAVRK